MNQYRYILFDLDGTLTDPKEGITKSVQYACQTLGYEAKNLNKLEAFIGPPLKVSFRDLYGMDDETVSEAIRLYRERFQKVGVYENIPYKGIHEVLDDLVKEGYVLAIASSKPKHFVDIVLKHFSLEKYFEYVVGSELDGTRDSKTEVIYEALRLIFSPDTKEGDLSFLEEVPKELVLMVGDRKYDILSAGEVGIDAMGVLYGYAKEGELEEAKATYIVENFEQMRTILFLNNKQISATKPAILKTADVLLPLFIFWGISLLFRYTNKASNIWITFLEPMIAGILLTVLYQKRKIKEVSYKIVDRNRKLVIRYLLPTALLAIAVAIGMNIALEMLGIKDVSFSNGIVQEGKLFSIYSFALFGVLYPVVEELTFRGGIYQQMKTYYPDSIAIIVSAVLFGAYHGNIVQFVYGTIMGVLLALVYRRVKHFASVLVFHISANMAVLVGTNVGLYTVSTISTLILAIVGGTAIICGYYMFLAPGKRKK